MVKRSSSAGHGSCLPVFGSRPNRKEPISTARIPATLYSSHASAQPFWHINGELTKEGIYRQITDAYQKDGFGGVAVLSLTPAKMWGGKEICPGTTPEYLSESYFDRYRDILECSEQLGTDNQ